MDQLIESDRQSSPVARARQMLARAEWASLAYRTYNLATVRRIAQAAAQAAGAAAAELAEAAVAETGYGVVADKTLKNEACSTGLVEHYRDGDWVSTQWDAERAIARIPRPAGIVVALTPSTNPVATVYFKTLLALMTRNAVVISPHPAARESSARAAHILAEAAVAAGAPDGVVQVVEKPSIPVIDALMTDPRTSLIVATGGSAVVRAAYSSGNPAYGVGPGNVPVMVDRTADVTRAAKAIVASKAFDNSVLCTNESVLIVDEQVRPQLLRAMRSAGAVLLDDDQTQRLRSYLFPNGSLNTAAIGKSASHIAQEVGIRSPRDASCLLAPFGLAVPEEPLTHEKLCPVLGVTSAHDPARGIAIARAVLRIAGAGHSAAIHSSDPRTITDFAASVPVLRVSVNVGNSTGSSGLDTNLAPTMTIGTGFVGRSSLGANLAPHHLVNYTEAAFGTAPGTPVVDLGGLELTHAPQGPVPPYPAPSNADPAADLNLALERPGSVERAPASPANEEMREAIRRMVIEELTEFINR